MNTADDNHELSLLCEQVRLSPEPIAILYEHGEVAFINSAMQQSLPGGNLPGQVLSTLTESEAHLLITLYPTDEESSAGRQLLAIRLGHYWLVTFLEREVDPQVERLSKLLEEAQKSSITDPLTGLWNRKQFDEFLRIEIPRAERYGQPICLIVLDIDHFKLVNDEQGHAVGDRVLQQLSHLMSQQVRLVDSLFRWGGEEFAILLPNTAISATRFIAERLRQAVSQFRFDLEGDITVSIGAAELERGETALSWFKRADEAMYAAKYQGRNRVVCADAITDRFISGEDADSSVLMPWKPIYECGHPLIDQQHQELFRLGNKMISASLDETVGKEHFLLLADELIEHCTQHFSDEEDILANIGYDGFYKHQKAHNGLLSRARKLRSQAQTGTVTTRDVIDFLVNKLVKQHLLTADMDFFEQLMKPSAVENKAIGN